MAARTPCSALRAKSAEPLPIPPAARQVVDVLTAAGFEAWLVGGCVRDLLRGEAVGDFDVATAAPPERVLELLPRAIPVALHHGTVTVPTGAGPVDVTTFRAGPRVEDDLARRDLTVNAMAWDARAGRLLDPFGGRADLEARLLRPVGSAEERFAEDPLRALRVARLTAQLGFRAAPSLEPALRRAGVGLLRVARERIRRELEALLVARHARRGLDLLRRTGLEAELAPGTRPDGPAVVGRLAPELVARLAGWLRGTKAESILLRLRFPRATAARVGHLVRAHPIEAGADPESGAEVRRLIRRAGEENLPALFALREAELAAGGAPPGAQERLEALRCAIDRARAQGALALRRRDLALGGRDVMELLGCGPGPQVGQALQYLTECVLDDPACNTLEALRARLAAWSPAPGDR